MRALASAHACDVDANHVETRYSTKKCRKKRINRPAPAHMDTRTENCIYLFHVHVYASMRSARKDCVRDRRLVAETVKRTVGRNCVYVSDRDPIGLDDGLFLVK